MNDDTLFISDDLKGRFDPEEQTLSVMPSIPMMLTLVFHSDHVLCSLFAFGRLFKATPDAKMLTLELEMTMEMSRAVEEYAFHINHMLVSPNDPTILIEMDHGAETKVHTTQPFILMHVGFEQNPATPETATLHFKLIQLREVE